VGRRSARFYLSAIIAFLLLIEAAVLLFAITFDRDRSIARTKLILQQTAISLEERVLRTYTASEAILDNLAQRIQDKGIERIAASQAEWEHFRRSAEALPEAGSLWLLDAEANLRLDSTAYPSQPMNYTDREYFIPHRDGRSETYIGPVVKGRITHKHSFTISRRIEGPDGRFLGIVLAALDTEGFTNFLRTLDIGEDSAVTIFRTDAALILRQPMQDKYLGQNFKHLKLFSLSLDKTPAGSIESARIDGTDRLIAYRKVEGLPLIVTTTIPVASALQDWRTRVRYYALMAAVVFFILLILSRQAFRSIAREEQAHREVLRAGEEVARLNEALERRVRERTAELEASNKELEAFTYTVSHDLRAPLRAIDGFASILIRSHTERLDAEGRRVLGIIRKNAQDMGRLIDDLLAFSRLERQKIHPAEMDLTRLAQSVYEELKAAAPERDVTALIGALPAARGDRAMIRQVLAQLLSNALKFTRHRDAAVIEVGGGADEARNENIYFVKDNGAGFDMRYADRLFGVFQRLHDGDDFEGNGVGLAIVQRVILKHGGRVWAEAKVNEGATVYFSLPR
jgi:signal transduction histidine kinase